MNIKSFIYQCLDAIAEDSLDQRYNDSGRRDLTFEVEGARVQASYEIKQKHALDPAWFVTDCIFGKITIRYGSQSYSLGEEEYDILDGIKMRLLNDINYEFRENLA